MARKETDGSAVLPHREPQRLGDPCEGAFDWVDYKCQCPHCGRQVNGFRTKDLCNMLDTVDYRIAHHFYAECECGAWIDFIRKPAGSADDFDMAVELP